MPFTDVLSPDILDVVGVASDGELWHTRLTRGDDGAENWTPWKKVEVQGAANPGPFVRADCAPGQNQLHICAVSQDGKLWYKSPGQPFDDLSTHIGDVLGGFQDVGVAEFKGDLHVCGVTPNGWLMRTIRHSNGQWEHLEDVSVVAASMLSHSRSFVRVDCATGSQCLHLCAVTDDGKLFYACWSGNEWTRLADVESEFATSNVPGNFTDVSVSEENNELHFYALSQGEMWYTAGRAGPILWQPVVDNALAGSAGTDSFIAVDCVGVEERLGYQRHVHVCGVTQDGVLWYKPNFVEPAVPLPFENVTDTIQAPGPFVSICVASNLGESLGQSQQPVITCDGLQREVNTDCALIARTTDPGQKANLQHRVRTLLSAGQGIGCALTVPGGCLS